MNSPVEYLEIELYTEPIDFDIQLNSRPEPLLGVTIIDLASGRNATFDIYANSIDNRSKDSLRINPAGATSGYKDNKPLGITDYFKPNLKATIQSFNKDITLTGGILYLSINSMLYTINLEPV